MKKQTILTGIRPTGHLHLGHYFGAGKNWIKLQDKFDTYIEIADVQALTDNFNNPDKVRKSVKELVIDLLSIGIDPNKATIFIQSTIPENLKGIGLAQESFKTLFGDIGVKFVAVSLFFFAFSTIIAWYFFGEQNIRYLFGEKAVRVYSLLAIIFIFIGSTLKVDLVWSLADCFNAMMVIPNIIGVLALSGTVSVLYNEYQKFKKDK